jgi:acetyl-CoA carboxylase biotin carboxyl carrier protein
VSDKLTTSDVQRILDILDASQFDELHLETGEFKLTLRRSSAPDVPAPYRDIPASPAVKPVAARLAKDLVSRPDLAVRPGDQGAASELAAVKAPMLGVFYRSPKPGANPFVEVGDKVERDTVVGIVEVMKLMHSVAAEITGEVVEIVAANGEMVEFGQTLLRIRRH